MVTACRRAKGEFYTVYNYKLARRLNRDLNLFTEFTEFTDAMPHTHVRTYRAARY